LATERVERRLIAVLAADIAGYSRLTELDEEGTLARLRAHRCELIDAKIEEHNGRIVRATGDSLLAEFASATEAVRCAVEVQRGMIKRNVNTAPDRRIAFRVGVNTGEVTTDDGDLIGRAVAALSTDRLAALVRPESEFFGDVGNIAGRVAALAEPAGVCISGPVREAVGDELPYLFKDLGSHNLGRGGAPVRCYGLSGDPNAWISRVSVQRRQVSATGRMRLRSAVLAAGALVTVGIWAVAFWAWLDADSLTASLSALKTFGSQMASAVGAAAGKDSPAPAARQSAPISDMAAESRPAPVAPQSAPMSDRAPSSSDQAIVALSPPSANSAAVEKAPQAPTLRPTLPDSATAAVSGNQPASPAVLATDNPTKVLESHPAPEPQSPPSQPAVAAPVIGANETPSVIDDKEQVDPAARELIIQGRALYYSPYTPVRWQEARNDFEQALELDSRSNEARIGLAATLSTKLAEGWSPILQEDMPQAEHLLANVLDKGDASSRSEAHFTLGVLRQMQNRLSEAQSEFETAITLDPDNARASLHLGETLLYLGRPEAAIPPLEQSIQLAPNGPNIAVASWILGTSQLLTGRADRAVDLLQAARVASTDLWVPYLYLAGAYGLEGDLDKAKSALAESIRLKPAINSLTRMRVENPWLSNPQYWALQEQTLNVGLRRAGLPDQ
jgi:class 3 adenylate cyclase/tetratricopeptide (TPR) repeat protein